MFQSVNLKSTVSAQIGTIPRKVYRFRMRPTKEQGHALNRMAGACRWVWNWALRRWKEHYASTGKSIPLAQLSAELTALKQQPETAWLQEANAQALQQVLEDLRRAFQSFFEKRARYPKFKSRKRGHAAFRLPQGVKVKDGKVNVSKIDDIRIFQSQDVTEKTKSATFKRAADGKWYVSLVVEFEMPDIPIPMPDPAQTVGIDVGLIDFATFSDPTAQPIPAPKFFRKGQRQLRRAQRTVSRRQHGSKRRAKAVRKAAVVHRKFADQRRDFQHKLSTKIVDRYAAVCVEDLSLSGLARTKLAKSFNDAAFGAFFRQFEVQVPLELQTLHPDRPILPFVQDVQRLRRDQRSPHALGSGVGLRLFGAPSEGLPRGVPHQGRGIANARRRAGRRVETLRETVSDPVRRAVVVELRIPRL